VAKARVNVKRVSRAVDQLTKDLKNLRKTPATPARRAEVSALHRKLTTVKTLLVECPDSMFRMFEIAEPTAARRAKTTRKRTRKGR
jgi:hypothetical protein